MKKSLLVGLIVFPLVLVGCSMDWLIPPTPGASKMVDDAKGDYPPKQNVVPGPIGVAIFVPLQGEVGQAGQAIRDGFLTAYQSTSGITRPAEVDVVDSSQITDMDAAYKQAIDKGDDFVVGPLIKSQVQALAQVGAVLMPTLTLNYLPEEQKAPIGLYQFGLSPLDEARQAAALAKRNGLDNALIVVPDSGWGRTVAQAFHDQWGALGGKIVGTLTYQNNGSALTEQIRNLLRTHRGYHYDAVFLAATPAQGRQIVPLLQFYGTQKIPVYATALIYAGHQQPQLDNDLNGVTFCDVPWALGATTPFPELRAKLAERLDFEKNVRLYALGVDAYYLMGLIGEEDDSSKRISMKGATGNLYLNDQHRVVRQLACAQFQGGVPVMLGDLNNQ